MTISAGGKQQKLTAEDKLRPWLKFDDKEFWVMVGKLKIRMATLGERDPIGYKRQKMGLPHQNSESAREYQRQRQAYNNNNGYNNNGYNNNYNNRGHSPNYRGHSPNYRGHSPNYRGRGGFNQTGRGGYDNNRGRGGFNQGAGGYQRGGFRGGYDNNRGGFRGRGRGGFRGGYNNGMNGEAGGKYNNNTQFNVDRTTPY